MRRLTLALLADESLCHGIFMGCMMALCLIGGCLTGTRLTYETLTRQAVRHGVGEWVIDSSGDVVFKWKDVK
jgi:hypothetical protein